MLLMCSVTCARFEPVPSASLWMDGVIFITDLFIWNYAARRFASPGFPKFFSGIGRGSHFRSDFKLANCAGKEG